MTSLKRHIAIFLYIVFAMHSYAQNNEIHSDEIASLQVMAGDDWLNMPVIRLGGNTPITIAFDDLTHEYRRFGYRIEHCEADWSVSEGLFTSDYIDGFSDQLFIEDDQQSINTATLYTHYRLQLPNNDVRIKMSGNYKVSIFDDNGDVDNPLMVVYFMVAEQSMGIGLDITTNTDIDINHSHQQVNMSVSYNNLNVIDPDRQIKTVVMQNGRWLTARRNARPLYRTASGLQWQHCRDYIFDAGNEHHKFEFLDLHRNALGFDHTSFDGTDYHVWLYTDEPRLNYVYDVSAGGAFSIKNSENYENDIASEYVMVHFTYHTDDPLPGEVYVNGWWTNEMLSPQYRMDWNEENHCYECAVMMKMGYYSYQYILATPDGKIITSPYDGNYFETANTYQAMVYFRETGGRTDRLVGYVTTSRKE